MRRKIVALTVLGAVSCVAHAQSNVAIYGVLDSYLQSYKTNVVVPAAGQPENIQSLTLTKIDGGGLSGNRWGLRIREDIGGGLSVLANLESGFSIDTGASNQGGRLFGRRATVGLSGDFGTVTVGRNASPYSDGVYQIGINGTVFDPAYGNTGAAVSPTQAGSMQGSAANSAAFLRQGGFTGATWVGGNIWFDNSIKYISPNFSGFSASAMLALGENKTTTQSASQTVSASLQYANGPVKLIGSYQSEGSARTATTKPTLENIFTMATYDFGAAKLGLAFNRAKYKDVLAPVGLGGGAFAPQKEVALSISIPIGATELSAAYARGKGDTLGASTGFGVQAIYALSKRTSLYAGAVSTKTFDKLTNVVNAGASGAINPLGFGVGANGTGRLQIYAIGFRHRF